MEITNKRIMYDLQLRHKLGNSLRIWTIIPEVRRSGYEGPIAIRAMIPGLGIKTHINQEDLERSTEEYIKEKECNKSDIVYSEMASPSMGIRRLLNAEITQTEEGLYLAYNDENIHMTEAMKRQKIAIGLTAKLLLDFYQDPSDLDDLKELMETYPDSIMEFSLMDGSVGWANRRMVVWEVRNY